MTTSGVPATAPYLTQKKSWPKHGRVILAHYDEDTIVVYQAFKPSIAKYAVEHQRLVKTCFCYNSKYLFIQFLKHLIEETRILQKYTSPTSFNLSLSYIKSAKWFPLFRFGGPDFSFERMSWIKTNFLWMMYRCGWASKKDQQRVLAVRLSHEGFKEILRHAYSAKVCNTTPSIIWCGSWDTIDHIILRRQYENCTLHEIIQWFILMLVEREIGRDKRLLCCF